ncbi:kinase-like protein [Saitoella complicata NRRL Y-17804]|nr:kinase-like protein [Saitoella complicata NRRL Y-17804]ODQ50160.1 kinase-like protein [Saitoella complicata NRRL Y-17804]
MNANRTEQEQTIQDHDNDTRYLTAQLTLGLTRLYSRVGSRGMPHTPGDRPSAKRQCVEGPSTATEDVLMSPPTSRASPYTSTTLLANRYQVTGTAGQGAWSHTLLAIDTYSPSHPTVAIKVMNPGLERAGAQELRVLREIHGVTLPYGVEKPVVKAFGGFVAERGRYCLVLEALGEAGMRAPGCTCGSGGGQGVEHESVECPSVHAFVRKVAVQLLQELVLLHEGCGMIHADIKPENVLRVRDSSPTSAKLKLIDFGNAIRIADIPDYYGDYEVQSAQWRAPEVLLGVPFGPKVDCFSVGVILAELLLSASNEQVEALFPPASSRGQLVRAYTSMIGALPKRFSEGMYWKPEYANIGSHTLRAMLTRCKDTQLVDFICGLMEVDPDKRFSARQALGHPWIVGPLLGVWSIVGVEPQVPVQGVSGDKSHENAATEYRRVEAPASVYSESARNSTTAVARSEDVVSAVVAEASTLATHLALQSSHEERIASSGSMAAGHMPPAETRLITPLSVDSPHTGGMAGIRDNCTGTTNTAESRPVESTGSTTEQVDGVSTRPSVPTGAQEPPTLMESSASREAVLAETIPEGSVVSIAPVAAKDTADSGARSVPAAKPLAKPRGRPRKSIQQPPVIPAVFQSREADATASIPEGSTLSITPGGKKAAEPGAPLVSAEKPQVKPRGRPRKSIEGKGKTTASASLHEHRSKALVEGNDLNAVSVDHQAKPRGRPRKSIQDDIKKIPSTSLDKPVSRTAVGDPDGKAKSSTTKRPAKEKNLDGDASSGQQAKMLDISNDEGPVDGHSHEHPLALFASPQVVQNDDKSVGATEVNAVRKPIASSTSAVPLTLERALDEDFLAALENPSFKAPRKRKSLPLSRSLAKSTPAAKDEYATPTTSSHKKVRFSSDTKLKSPLYPKSTMANDHFDELISYEAHSRKGRGEAGKAEVICDDVILIASMSPAKKAQYEEEADEEVSLVLEEDDDDVVLI